MQYKLIENSKNDIRNILETVLLNRGIKDPQVYLNLTDECMCDWRYLDNINEAVECFAKHFDTKDDIAILVDSDCDGYTSASMMYNYIKKMDSDYPVHYMLHERNKAHGLADHDFTIPEGTKLLILPDSSTNDCKECNELIDNGMSIIILDHHLQEKNDVKSKAIVVNNQISENYSNKDFCGAGIVYEFLRALDDYYWQDYADDFIDLCSFGNISDVMKLSTPATRYVVDIGLKNIQNPALTAMADAQSYSMNNEINIHNVSWYMTPIFNAMIRIGDIKDRELLFRAFIEDYEEFDYKKRGGDVVKETIYDRAARLCKNAKSRQDKMRDKLFEELVGASSLANKVVMVRTTNGDSGIIGLSAMKLADKLSRPVVVLKEITKDGKTILSGSCRNFNNSPIESLKKVISDTGMFEYAQGHDNAAGCGILPENFDAAQIILNETLKDIVYDPTYKCDFVIDVDDIGVSLVQTIDSARWVWCQGISEPIVAVENINLIRSDINIQGKNHDSISFEVNGIKFVQFKLTDGDPFYEFINSWDQNDNDEICVNVVGTCGVNWYGGIATPQLIISGVNTIQD